MKVEQTAVEWLLEKIEHKNGKEFTSYYLEFIDQAKEMEKEQIKDSFGVGCQVLSTRLIGYHEMAEQYYNETYKSK
jgi:hypothetical protein